MYSFRLEKLHFSGADKPYVPKSKITVLIGPNNSGKSQALREIRTEILGHPSGYSGQEDFPSVIFKGIEFNLPDNFEKFNEAYELENHVVKVEGGWRVREQCNQGVSLEPNGYCSVSSNQPMYGPSQDWRELTERSFASSDEGEAGRRGFLRFVGPLLVDYSGVEDRLLLSIGQQAHGMLDSNYNTLSASFDYDPDCNQFCKEARELFGRDVVLDALTHKQSIVPRTSDDFSAYRETNVTMERIRTLVEAKPLSREGDGLRGFAALFFCLSGSDKPILLIDEPEAFLHPPHALRTGELIARMVRDSQRTEQVFIATHSAMLLQGLLNGAGDDLSIIRLKRNGGGTQFKLLENGLVKKQIDRSDYSPLYLDGLFSSSVILVEAPRDASIYAALARVACGSFMPIFVPTNGKHRIPELLKFYEAAGVSCAAVADFDVLNDREFFKKLLDAASVGNDERQRALDIRDDLEAYHCSPAPNIDGANEKKDDPEKEFKDKYKKGMAEVLDDGLFVRVRELLELLAQQGVCVVSSGDMESIFVNHPCCPIEQHSHSDDWFEKAMAAIGEHDVDELVEGEAIASIIGFLRGRNDACY